MLSLNNYNKKPFAENNIDITKLKIHKSWKALFEDDINQKLLQKVNVFLNKQEVKSNIFPHPDLLFNAFNKTHFDKIKVVILGQDPYHNCINHNGKNVPQAMGLSFSIPTSVKIPSSLKNIYKNQLKYKHISKMPKDGNLEGWAKQGCLLLNTSLTVKKSTPNSHTRMWTPFTDNVIKYISDNCDNIVFVLWGGPALKKEGIIDSDKHKVIISSHPSGLSCNKTLRGNPAFLDRDCFGEINEYLKENGKKEIKW